MQDGKLEILYLMKILTEETDKDHALNAQDLVRILDKRFDISVRSRTIYSDIARLRRYGIPVEQKRGSRYGYYVEDRLFSLPELKLLVDAVQASKFITISKSEVLIGKLEGLAGRRDAASLQRQVFIYNRTKAENETIYTSVDLIHAAMNRDRQISFRYCAWTPDKKLRPRRGGAFYILSPWSLTWDEGNYYLVAFDAVTGQIRHYRVDKMQDMTLTDLPRKGRERFEDFDLAAFSRKTFSMYAGPDRTVTLRCRNELAGVLIDRFGQDIMTVPAGEGFFRTHVTVAVSPQFYGWVTGIGEGLTIEGPASVRDGYRIYLEQILAGFSSHRIPD